MSMGIFSDAQGQLTPQSEQSGRNSNSSLMHVTIACKCEKDLMKNSQEKVDTVFSIITLWELSVAIETRVLI